jgi:catechol 2,3-dioxygenase-like lactoylglutathione lyase family enzyme
MDEIFGFFPPVANPPSKQPLLTLLKQARAFGLGVTLATQNPVDLDYKGLANAGTWFIGRLQTERDRARVLDGLQAAAGAGMDRQRLESLIAQLRDRVFLMNNVHEDAPVVLETRWVMSYLRGPLTRTQIKALMSSRGQAPVKSAVEAEPVRAPEESAVAPAAAGNLPVLPPDVPQTFAPVRGSAPEGATLLYRPSLLGVAQIRFTDARSKLDLPREVTRITPIAAGPIPVDWQAGTDVEFCAGDLEQAPSRSAEYEAPAAAAAKPKSYAAWSRDFGAWLYGSQTLTIFRSPSLDMTSQPGETERDFRVRLQQSARERRDEAKDNLRKKYAPKMAAITERIRRAELAADREKEQASAKDADGYFGWGHIVERVPGPEDSQRRHARSRNHGSSIRKPRVEGDAGHRPRRRDGGRHETATGGSGLAIPGGGAVP